MEYIDLTYKLKNEIPEYPGDPKTKLDYFKKADETDSSTLFKLETGLHTGHIWIHHSITSQMGKKYPSCL